MQDGAFGKLDYQLNRANRLSANFNFGDFHAPNAFTAANSNGSTVSNGSVTQSGPAVTRTRFFVANWNSNITQNLINQLRFQWGVDFESTGVNAGGPGVSIANVMAYGLPSQLPRSLFPNERRTQIADTLSFSRGHHQLKVGFDVNLIHDVIVNLFQGNGGYSYTGTAAAAFNNWALDVFGINTGDGRAGKHYANFIQAYDPITGVGKDDFWNNDYAWFVEDRWKLRTNLTLNLGIRYDVQTISQPPKPNTATPLLTELTSKINIDSNNFGPRIGLAWRVREPRGRELMLTIEFPLPVRGTRPKPLSVAATTTPSGRPPRLARLLALARKLDEVVRNGTAKNYRDLAELGHVSPARLSQIVVLLNLAPPIQEYVLFLSAGEGGFITELELRNIARERRWDLQIASFTNRAGAGPARR